MAFPYPYMILYMYVLFTYTYLPIGSKIHPFGALQ